MLDATEPGQGPLDPHAEAAVGHGAVAAQVEVPFERFGRKLVLADPGDEGFQAVLALAASDDFPIALRGEQVARERQPVLARIPLHVEGLHGRREAMDEEGAVVGFGERRFVGGAEVAAPFEGEPSLGEDAGRLVVGEPREGCADAFQRRHVALEDLQLLAPLLEHASHDPLHEALDQAHDVVQGCERHFRLHHPELDEMPAGLRFLGAERRPEAVRLPERHRGGFVVELPALRQVRLLIEVLGLEERRRSLARGRREDRRVGEDEPVRVEPLAAGLDERMAHLEDRRLPLRADPEVALVQEEGRAVLLRRDRKINARPDELEVAKGKLDAARRALVLAYDAGHANGRLLGDRGTLREDVLGKLRLHGDALHGPASVPNEEKLELPARAPVVEPSLNPNFLADSLPKRPDPGGSADHGCSSVGMRRIAA